MLARVRSSLLQGIDALPCEVEIDYDPTAIDKFPLIVGLPDAAVKESLERVRSAMTNSGYYPPSGRVLINLAPADLKKEGVVYDLPIAAGMLAVCGVIRDRPEGGLDYRCAVMAGELALDGRVRPIKGALALASMARATGARAAIVPAANASEAAVVGGIDVYGVETLAELVGLLTGKLEMEPHPPLDVARVLRQAEAPIDFEEVRGQEGVKRAITISASGSHNLFQLCPCGSNGVGGRLAARALIGGLIAPTACPRGSFGRFQSDRRCKVKSTVVLVLVAGGLVVGCQSPRRAGTSSDGLRPTPPEGAADGCCAYREDFDEGGPSDCHGDGCEVVWCADAEICSSECSPPHGLEVRPNKTSTGTVLWVGFGGHTVSEVRIGFKYIQWEGYPPVVDAASSYVEVKGSRSGDFDPDHCPQSGYTPVRTLNKTSSTMTDCNDESCVYHPDEGEKGVLIRFRKKGTYTKTPILIIDDLSVDVVASDG
ncbi:MAG: ATP-binding protein [Phycisphaerales bacterium]|nr:ATP-binding protein [Phycisphaerales bacterium]